MEEEIEFIEGADMRTRDGIGLEESYFAGMETQESETLSTKNKILLFTSDDGEGSNVVFSREASLTSEESRKPGVCGFGAKKYKPHVVGTEPKIGKKENLDHDKRLCRQDRNELGCLFQGAVNSHDWNLAESLILLADPQTLNDALCITLDSVWFLSTHQELHGITGLIKKIIGNGAYDFTRAALRTSFLASCVSACQSRTMNLADTVTVMAQRYVLLREKGGSHRLKSR